MKINWKKGQLRYGKNNAYAYISNGKYCVGINGTSVHSSFTSKDEALKYLNIIKN
jgi:hypothetical protein